MIAPFNVLIADDEEEIVEILSFVIKSSLKCDVQFAYNGKSAVELLSKGDIQLIICDYNMPLMNGGDVYKYILDSMPSCRYVLCSSELPERHDEYINRSCFYGHIQKPQVMGGTKVITDKIKSELPQMNEPKSHSYVPISPRLLFKISTLPSDIFLKLSDNKYVKVFNQGAVFDELDLIKYGQTAGDKLYTFNLSIDTYLARIQETLLKVVQTSSAENQVEANLQIHFLLSSAFKDYGLKEALIPLVDVQIKEATELCKNNKTLTLMLDKLLKSKDSYVGKHSFMLAAVSVSMAEKMEWNSSTTGQKLVVASLFHDIFLKESFTSEMINVSIESRDSDFLSHGQKAADLLDKIPQMPPDTGRIILEHHEIGEEEGFPRGISISKTTPLSQLFTFSHFVVDLLLESNKTGKFDKEAFYLKLEAICSRSSKYTKLLEVFRSVDFFE